MTGRRWLRTFIAGALFISFFTGAGINKSNAASDGTFISTFSTNFSTGNYGFGSIKALKSQSNGKILILGALTSNSKIFQLIRLNADGSQDNSFQTATVTTVGSSYGILTVGSDDSIAIVGKITKVTQSATDTACPLIVKLNPSGSVNTAWCSSLTGTNATNLGIKDYLWLSTGSQDTSPYAAYLSTDGSVLMGGELYVTVSTNLYNAYDDGVNPVVTPWQSVADSAYNKMGLIKVNSDGTVNTTFKPFYSATPYNFGIRGNVNSIDVSSNGDIYVLGGVGNATAPSGFPTNTVKMIASNGVVNNAFSGPTYAATQKVVKVLGSGKILVGGNNASGPPNLMRLDSTGASDNTFITPALTSGTYVEISALDIQSNGQILVVGNFTEKFARINTDGTLDATFGNNVSGVGFNSFPTGVLARSSGEVLVAGSFTSPGSLLANFGNAPATSPSAPTVGSATKTGATTATVAFTAPTSDGGSTITSYTATSSPGGITGTLTQAGSGTISITGLTASTSYTFTVVATNSIGNSSASAASNSITTDSGVVTLSSPTPVISSLSPNSFVISYSAANGTSSVTARIYESDGLTLVGGIRTSFISGTTVTGLTIGKSYKVSLTAIGNGSTYLNSGESSLVTATTPVPPPPSYLKMVTAPMIKLENGVLTCQTGEFVFMRLSSSKETSKIESYDYALLADKTQLYRITTNELKVSFTSAKLVKGTTYTCDVYARQESSGTTASTLSNPLVKTSAQQLVDIAKSATTSYYEAIRNATAVKVIEQSRILNIKNQAFAKSKTVSDIQRANSIYQSDFAKALKTWKDALSKAKSDREKSNAEAFDARLKALEIAGAQIKL